MTDFFIKKRLLYRYTFLKVCQEFWLFLIQKLIIDIRFYFIKWAKFIKMLVIIIWKFFKLFLVCLMPRFGFLFRFGCINFKYLYNWLSWVIEDIGEISEWAHPASSSTSIEVILKSLSIELFILVQELYLKIPELHCNYGFMRFIFLLPQEAALQLKIYKDN